MTTRYLAAVDLADPESLDKILTTTVEMATGIDGATIYLMTVVPGITSGIDYRYAIRGEMKGSAITGPVGKECADNFPKIASAAPSPPRPRPTQPGSTYEGRF